MEDENSLFYQILRTEGNLAEGQLTDSHMRAVQDLLPKCNMQDTLFLSKPSFIKPVEGEFIQILFSGPSLNGHWICVQYRDDELFVYDSANGGLKKEHLIYLSRSLPNLTHLKVNYEDVQQQTQLFQCGCFTIGNVIALSLKICPCQVKFLEYRMRSHLIKMFLEKKVTMMPLYEINNDLLKSRIHKPFLKSEIINLLPFREISSMNVHQIPNVPSAFIDLSNTDDNSQELPSENENSIECYPSEQGNCISNWLPKKIIREIPLSQFNKVPQPASQCSDQYQSKLARNKLYKAQQRDITREILQTPLTDDQNCSAVLEIKATRKREAKKKAIERSNWDSTKRFCETQRKAIQRNSNNSSKQSLESAQMSVNLLKPIDDIELQVEIKLKLNLAQQEYMRERIDNDQKIDKKKVLNYRVGLICNTNYDGSLILPNYVGKKVVRCQFCNALHFALKRPNDKKFNQCCNKGNIVLKPDLEYPTELQKLMTGKSKLSTYFQQHTREINNAFALASFGATFEPLKTAGPPVLRISGLTYHNSFSLHFAEEETPKYAQLYIIDSEIAKNHRMNYIGDTKFPETLHDLVHKVLVKVNPYIKAYKHMFEVEQEEIRNASLENRLLRQIQMNVVRDNNPNQIIDVKDEIFMIQVGNTENSTENRDFCVYSRDSKPQRIPSLSQHLDPMSYPLMFPMGQFGWRPNLKSLKLSNSKKDNISVCEYYSYYLSTRNDFEPRLNMCKLTQQFILDVWSRILSGRLYWIRKYQLISRAAFYHGLMDALNDQALRTGGKVGKVVILPSSFEGSPRNFQQNYMDTMAVLSVLGKPSLFITMTCNPKWPEIQWCLKPWETSFDRPDIVSEVFSLELAQFEMELVYKQCFGKSEGSVFVVEFQKRGLPHVHSLIYLNDFDKIRDTGHIDKIISAEIPDKAIFPRKYTLVKAHMIHGPCGELNMNSPCIDPITGLCTKGYPQLFYNETEFATDGYPKYRRQRNSNSITFSSGLTVDNRWVVPYNDYLLLLFETHINIEICSTIHLIKYLYKYLYKGPDTATVKVTVNEHSNECNTQTQVDEKGEVIIQHDEIVHFLNTHFTCPPEAAFRIQKLPLHKLSHTVYRLSVHLENQNLVYFEEGREEEVLEKYHETHLTAWFKLNKIDPEARKYRYVEICQHYVFDEQVKKWNPRKKFNKPTIGRVYFVSAKDQERFYLRMILMNVRGATSFEDLRTVDNVVYQTYKEAALQLGLIQSDDEWDKCLGEASTFEFPSQFCELFAHILISHAPHDAAVLFEKYKVHFLDRKKDPKIAEQEALKRILKIIDSHGFSLETFGLPLIEQTQVECSTESYTDQSTPTENTIEKLTIDQKKIFNLIEDSLKGNKPNCRVFIDGPGGSGKSFLLDTLITSCKSVEIPVFTVAWTGIAANLLIDGKTASSGFKLPLDLDETSICNIMMDSSYAKFLRSIRLLVWDEISMVSRYAFETVNKLFQDLHSNQYPFGGINVVIAGDFRQILPIVHHGSRTQIVNTCVKRSALWNTFEKVTLKDNIRVSSQDGQFKKWLLDIGENRDPTQVELENNCKLIPDEFLTDSDLVSEIFGEKVDPFTDSSSSYIILSPRNEDVLQINEKVLEKVEGETKEYIAVDYLEDGENDHFGNSISIDFMNSITPSGLPPFRLKLKIGCIIILQRNVNLHTGLCNGTRMIVLGLKTHVILAEILSGKNKGDKIFIPRLNVKPSQKEVSFSMVRRQFPIRLGFAMTINKSQGQSFEKVGVYLPAPVFAHGQLYVALSRVRSKKNLKILLKNDARFSRKTLIKSLHRKERKEETLTYTTNVVYPEIFYN